MFILGILVVIGILFLVLISGFIYAVRHAPLAEEQEDGSYKFIREDL